MRKHDINKINLQVDDIEFFCNKHGEGCSIFWLSDIGWGEYVIKKEGDKLCGYSECMDIQEDKAFIKKLFELIAEKLEIKE